MDALSDMARCAAARVAAGSGSGRVCAAGPGFSMSSMRSICLSLLCAWEAFEETERKRSANSWRPCDLLLLVLVGGGLLLFVTLFALAEEGGVVAGVAEDELALVRFRKRFGRFHP
jgi:hypothetical protein